MCTEAFPIFVQTRRRPKDQNGSRVSWTAIKVSAYLYPLNAMPAEGVRDELHYLESFVEHPFLTLKCLPWTPVWQPRRLMGIKSDDLGMPDDSELPRSQNSIRYTEIG